MNFALSDEQMFLREAARGSLSRFKTIEAARDALEDPSALPDLWPMAVEAGWPGLLISEEHGGAGLGGFDALLVAEECGRVLAAVPLIGLLPATAILDAAGDESLAAVAAGEVRPVYVPARPPSEREERWTVEPHSGMSRAALRWPPPTVNWSSSTARSRSCPTRPGADLLVVVAVDAEGEPVAVAVEAAADGVTVEPVMRYDATRSLANVSFAGARGRRLDVDASALEDAWYLAHALIAAESIGACADVPGHQRRLRQGAVHVRSRDRLLPGGQARADRGPAPDGELPRPAVLRRLGARRPRPTSSRWRPARPAARRATRWTSPPAR